MEGMSSKRSGFKGWRVMQVNMYCWKACCVVVLSFMRISVVEDMFSRWACLAGLCISSNYLSCY